jgi:predicted  nucleic acid-binding Zn-ribbon protein
MDLEDENIKLASERIERQEDHLRSTRTAEKEIRSMEQAISGAKAQRTWMNQQMEQAMTRSRIRGEARGNRVEIKINNHRWSSSLRRKIPSPMSSIFSSTVKRA